MSNLSSRIGSLLFVAALTSLGCGHDSNTPATLQQQQALAKGYAPTSQQLASAMERYKAPGSGGQTFGAPTAGQGGQPKQP